MKRCPECEFLYEDAQDRCDMDGTKLRFTAFLPPLPLPQPIVTPPLKSIWDRSMVLLLVLVLLGTVLVILYRATPPTFSSAAGVQNEPASQNVQGQNQNSKLSASDTPQQLVTEPVVAPESAELSKVQSTGTTKSNRSLPSENEKALTAAPATHIQIESPATISQPKPATSQPSISPAAPVTQKPSATSYSISAHPKPPPATPAPQYATQDPDKDSKFKSLLKKAGRVLKRPF